MPATSSHCTSGTSSLRTARPPHGTPGVRKQSRRTPRPDLPQRVLPSDRLCRRRIRPFRLLNRPYLILLVLFRLFVACYNLLYFSPHHPGNSHRIRILHSSPFLCPRYHHIALRALPLCTRHAHFMGLPVSASRADALPARTCRNGSSHPTASAAAESPQTFFSGYGKILFI